MFVLHTQLCVICRVKEVASFPRAQSINWSGAIGRFRKDVKLLTTDVYSRETVSIFSKNL